MSGDLAADPVVQRALHAAASLLFLSAAFHKVRDPGAFRAAVAGYRLLPDAAALPVAFALAAAEAAVGVGCLVPGAVSLACGTGALLLGAYGVAIAINLARGRRSIDCGCGGPGGRRPLSAGLVARNAVLVALLLAAAGPETARPLAWLDAVSATGLLLVLALLYAASDVALANAARLRPAGGTA